MIETVTPDLVELRAQLAVAHAELDAIRSGAADAFMADNGTVFHLQASDRPYAAFFAAMNEGGVTLDKDGAILHGNPRFAAMVGKSLEDLRGTSLLTYICADDRYRAATLLESGTAVVREVHLDRAGERLPVRLSLKTVASGMDRFHCLVVTDLSGYAKVEAKLRKAIQQQHEIEVRLRQRERDLRSIVDNVPSMIGYWDKNLRNRFGNHAYHTWFGIDSTRMSGMHIRDVIGEERYQLNLPLMEAALRGEPQTFERIFETPDGKGSRYSLAQYIPDVVDGHVEGFYALVTDITAVKRGETALRESEERLRAMYANQQAAIEAERKRVAREVHDELGQTLTALRMETLFLQRELQGQQAQLDRISEMRTLIESMFKTVRSIAVNLRPSTLDLGLVPAVEWLAEDFESRWQIDCALDIDPRDIIVDDQYATAVFRIIQESLTNVVRHAQATSVSILLRQSSNHMNLVIQDNGHGFTSKQGKFGGFGLIGMRERVLDLGGSMEVQSTPGNGTSIFIDLPFAVESRS